MSCTGCEGVIEEALKGLDGIVQVKASFTKNQVTVVYDPERITFGKIRAAVKKAGYTMEKVQDKLANKSDENKDKQLSVLQFIGIAVILLALYLIINHTVGFNFIPEVTSSMGYGVLFVVGLLTSLHCVAMCGGINMSQCVNSSGTAAGVKAKVKPSLLYNLGRVTSYTIIGGIIGAIGSVISFSGWARGIVAILSGIFMVIMGLM
jgi:copper chaperone CopZ